MDFKKLPQVLALLVVGSSILLASSAVAQKVNLTESGGKTEVIEGGISDSYTVVLAAQPTANVIITLAINTSQIRADKTTLTFTSANWSTAQTVTISAFDDNLDEGLHSSTITNVAASGDPNYNGTFVPNVVVSIVDNDDIKAAVNIVQSAGKTEVVEGGAGDSYTLSLSTQPSANVIVNLSVDTAQLGATPTTLTFTPANWASAQTVTVSAVNDALVEGLNISPITHTATSGDPDYNSLYVPQVFVSIIDNDSQKVAVEVAETGNNTEVAEGGSGDSFLVVLGTRPSANVTVTLSVNTAQLRVDKTVLTFTPSNWSISQAVAVTAVDDHVEEGTHLVSIGHTAASSDPDYNGVYVPSVVVSISDNDKAGVSIIESSGFTQVAEGGASDTYRLFLDSQPTSTVTVTLSVPTAQLSVSPTLLTFTPSNWAATQTVTITAVDDHLDEGSHDAVISHAVTSSDPAYNGVFEPSVLVSITDNDHQRLTVASPYGGTVPPVGANWYYSGAVVLAAVTNSPLVDGYAQYVCRGWSGSGNAPASGTTTNVGSFTIKTNSTITWLWRTNFWLDVESIGKGSLNSSDRWLAKGTNLLVTATPSNHWHFTQWDGQTNGCTIASNKITVAMDAPRAISASFWIDQHRLTVRTPFGQPSPATGTNGFDYGTSTNASVANSPVTDNTTQYVCRGWAGTGSVPASGITSNTAFVLTNDSSIVWLWSTNYWLDTSASLNGSVNVDDGWFARGSNVQITASANPHYHLAQWVGQTNSCTISSNKITAPMTQPRAITANFAIDQHKVIVRSVHGGALPLVGTNMFNYGSVLGASVSNSPLVVGQTQYVCVGWAGSGSLPAGSGTNSGPFTLTNDTVVAWQWTTNFWLDTTAGSNGSVNVGDGWRPRGSNVQMIATADSHYYFAGWSGQTNGCIMTSNVITAPMTQSRAITARFTVDRLRLSVTTPHGKASPSGTTTNNWGSLITATLTNSPVLNGTTQFVCKGWSGSGSTPATGLGTNTGPFTLMTNSTITWLWSTNFWLDTVTNGSGGVDVPDQWCSKGTNLVVMATPATFNRFTGWSGLTNGCTISSNQITVVMDRARAITAKFVRQFSLTMVSPYGQGFPSVGTNWYDTGASVTARLTNSPVMDGATQFVCRGWSGTGSVPASGTTTNAGPFTITTNSTITWLWRTNYWLDVGSTGKGSLNSSDRWLPLGTNLLVTATPSNHWHFTQWSGDTNGCSIVSNKITVAMNSPRAVMAGFAIDQHRVVVVSPYGHANPPVGTNWFDYGSSNRLAVTNSPVIVGATQYVCRGWSGAGSVPASGTATNTAVFVLTTNSVITWKWSTNYWLHIDKTGGGLVNTNDTWFAYGSNTVVTATPTNYFTFGHWEGQTNGCTVASNKITVVMNSPRTVMAVFNAALATNNVPKWWLAQCGLTNFNADAMQDIDHDGMLTWQEWVAGCNPTDSNSVFRFTGSHSAPSGQGMVVRWPSISNRFYDLSRATNLLGGSNAFIILPGASNMPAMPSENCYTDTVQGVGPYFYKIGVHE